MATSALLELPTGLVQLNCQAVELTDELSQQRQLIYSIPADPFSEYRELLDDAQRSAQSVLNDLIVELGKMQRHNITDIRESAVIEHYEKYLDVTYRIEEANKAVREITATVDSVKRAAAEDFITTNTDIEAIDKDAGLVLFIDGIASSAVLSEFVERAQTWNKDSPILEASTDELQRFLGRAPVPVFGSAPETLQTVSDVLRAPSALSVIGVSYHLGGPVMAIFLSGSAFIIWFGTPHVTAVRDASSEWVRDRLAGGKKKSKKKKGG